MSNFIIDDFVQYGYLETGPMRRQFASSNGPLKPIRERGLTEVLKSQNFQDYYWAEMKEFLICWQYRRRLDEFEQSQPRAMPHINRWLDNGAMLTLGGQVGQGKTTLTWVLASEVLQRTEYGVVIEHARWADLLGEFSRAEGFNELAQEAIANYYRAGVLILNDFGTSHVTTDTRFAALNDLIDTRFERGARTILSTNLSREKLVENVGERIMDRLLAGSYIQFKGGSHRPNNFVEV